MKIGIISDVHSNIDALNAILEEFNKNCVDKIIVLGDSIGIGAYPEEVMKILIQKKDMIIGYVLGNHEGYLLNGIPKYKHNNETKNVNDEISDEEYNLHSWNHRQLSRESIEFIKDISTEQLIEVCGKKIYLSHYPIAKNGKYKRFIKEANDRELKELYESVEADIYLYGHTHKQNIVCFEDKYYINPGSLGCPKGTDAACSVIVDINDLGEIEASPLNISYDVDKVINEIKKIKYPLCEFMIKVFYR